MTVYLGFSCSQHDPSIAVVDEDGEVVFAQANERALKCKRGWHSPPDAFGVIEPILKKYASGEEITANLTWSKGALSSSPYLAAASRLAIKAYNFTKPSNQNVRLWRGWFFRHALYRAPTSISSMLLNLEVRNRELNGIHSKIQKHAWDHHLCHAATACYASPYDEALCVVMDGMGEGSSTSVFSFTGGEIKRLDSRRYSNLASLGIYYSQLCFAAGFDPMAGEEWKLMGLAAYGKLDQELYQVLRSAITIKNNHFAISSSYETKLTHLMRYRDRTHKENADLAFTAQKVFEELVFEFLDLAYKRWGGENLIFTGGCALNSSANGKILSSTPFKNLHVSMAPGDDGNSIGAAILAWQADHPDKQVQRYSSPYLGSDIPKGTLKRLIEHGVVPCFEAETSKALTEYVANELARGSIVGWMQGRAEFGHRALGNRSILANPSSPNIVDRLNASVKFREEFRPFAPSILDEYGDHYFEEYSKSPYMERTLKWRDGLAPSGVRHVDNTGRLQSVEKGNNPLFHELLSNFHLKTDIPILLNTSFNVMGRPMVHDVEDALGVFFTSDIDILVLDNIVFRKDDSPSKWN